MLYRKIEEKIEDCLRNDSGRMPIVDGARQVGKSFIIRHVGKRMFPNYIEINMEEDKRGERLFVDVNTVSDFYMSLSTIAGDKMKDRQTTLHPFGVRSTGGVGVSPAPQLLQLDIQPH